MAFYFFIFNLKLEFQKQLLESIDGSVCLNLAASSVQPDASANKDGKVRFKLEQEGAEKNFENVNASDMQM